jgi:hypothetical protein
LKKTNYPCWWCGGKLMAVSHAKLSNGTKAHKQCQPDAERSLKRLTAQPTGGDHMDAVLADQLGDD